MAEQLGFPWVPSGQGGPIGGPVGPSGFEAELLGRFLGPGQDASLWRAGYPHDNHTDAILFRRFPDGRIYPIAKDHLG